ncbi:MAG: SAF domain-containing protein [Pyrinomonadaceae bacterium]
MNDVPIPPKDNDAPTPPKDMARWLYWAAFALVPLIALWMSKCKSAEPVVPTLTRDLPAYHLIKDEDVRMRRVAAGEVTNVTVRETSALSEHYTRRALNANQPVGKDDIVAAPDARLLTDVLVIPVPVRGTVVQGELPVAGAVVSLSAVPQATSNAPPEIVLAEALVLDVTRKGDSDFIILAIPVSAWPQYQSKTKNAQLVLAQRAR